MSSDAQKIILRKNDDGTVTKVVVKKIKKKIILKKKVHFRYICLYMFKFDIS